MIIVSSDCITNTDKLSYCDVYRDLPNDIAVGDYVKQNMQFLIRVTH